MMQSKMRALNQIDLFVQKAQITLTVNVSVKMMLMATNTCWMKYSGFVAHGISKQVQQPALQRQHISPQHIFQDVHTIKPANTHIAVGIPVQSATLVVMHLNFNDKINKKIFHFL